SQRFGHRAYADLAFQALTLSRDAHHGRSPRLPGCRDNRFHHIFRRLRGVSLTDGAPASSSAICTCLSKACFSIMERNLPNKTPCLFIVLLAAPFSKKAL